MNINISYDDNFTKFLNTMRKKYPEKLFQMEGIDGQLDINKFSQDLYSKQTVADNSIDANANVSDFTPATYINELTKPFLKLNSFYLLWKQLRWIYNRQIAESILEKQINGTIYINDFHGISSKQPYCFNFTALDLVNKGLPFINKIRTVPPKFLYSFKSQLEQFVVYASNNIMGATGIADLFVIMGWYVDKILENKSDGHFSFRTLNDCWSYVGETLASLIYTLNQPFRSAIQTPFTNVSIYDDKFLESIVSEYQFPNKISPKIETIKKIQEVFLDVMNKELTRTPVTFPVVTACFCVDKEKNIVDEEFLSMIADKNKDYGFINLYCGDTSTLSSCCRLRSKKSNPYFNSFGGASSKIGSLGVCTINLPRVAYETKDKDLFLKRIKLEVETTTRVNHAKRTFIKKGVLDGFLPLYTHGFIDLGTQYSTTGLTGINEALEILGLDILKEDGQEFLEQLLKLINDEVDKYQDKYDAPHNIEQVPSENSAVKLALKDKLLGLNKKYGLYSNQFIPLTTNADMLDRIELQGRYDSLFSGGAICHINIEQKIEDVEKIKDVIRHSAKKGVIYFALNYSLNECEDHHMSVGKSDICSICGKKIINTYTRVVGFLTNTKNWNKTRREQDFPNRKWY